MPSDLDLIVPRGLAVFRAGGSKQFFHGGLSPQELVVPVIVVDTEQAPAPTAAPGRCRDRRRTHHDRRLRSHARVRRGPLHDRDHRAGRRHAGSAKDVVARVVSGDGYDPATGSVTLDAILVDVLTFQVTSNLERDTAVEIQVLDARTGRLSAAPRRPSRPRSSWRTSLS